jgi:cytochrome c553
VTVRAEPVSRVSWAPDTLAILGRGDARLGASLASATCAACHGENGISPAPDFPHLAGQSAAAIFKQLSDYQSGARVNPLMTPIAQNLTVQQMAQVARYYAAAGGYGALGPRLELPDPATANLVQRGDASRRIPSCNSCHAPRVGGPIETPTLNGQHQAYLATQLNGFRTGDRRNDVYRRMRDIAVRLSQAEIDALSLYYQGLR